VDHVDAGHHPEQRTEQMIPGSNPGRRHVDFARIGLGVGNKLWNRFGRWVDPYHFRGADDARDRRDVADEIEIKFLVERCADRIWRSAGSLTGGGWQPAIFSSSVFGIDPRTDTAGLLGYA
jgi:hypothetical protein